MVALEDEIKGSLIPGQIADLTVFGKYIMTIPEDDNLSAEVVNAIIGSQVNHRKDSPRIQIPF